MATKTAPGGTAIEARVLNEKGEPAKAGCLVLTKP